MAFTPLAVPLICMAAVVQVELHTSGKPDSSVQRLLQQLQGVGSDSYPAMHVWGTGKKRGFLEGGYQILFHE